MKREKAESSWFVGVDVGQVQDHTALAAVERCVWLGDVNRATYERERSETCDVRRVERLPLGLPYPEISRRVVEVVERLQRILYYGQAAPRVELVLDATGVGAAVVDLVGSAAGAHVVSVVISGSGTAQMKSTRPGGEKWTVPKADLVGSVATALQSGELRIAGGVPGALELSRELLAMRAKISESGHATFEGAAGTHDDLVLAVALATWRARRKVRVVGFGGEPLAGMPGGRPPRMPW